jgi:hypothetical protein
MNGKEDCHIKIIRKKGLCLGPYLAQLELKEVVLECTLKTMMDSRAWKNWMALHNLSLMHGYQQ